MAKKPAGRKHSLRRPLLGEPKSDSCSKAAVILERTHESADALLKAYELAWASRGGPRGMSTDDEQDLLRAMLVMAASGLDSMLKQLIRDAVPTLVAVNERVREGLEKFATRSIRGEAEAPDSVGGTKFLARVLASAQPQKQVIEEYVRDLTGGSLQSATELNRIAGALGLTKIKVDHIVLNPIFNIRNKIIHELDINLDGDRRKRNLRGRDAMMKATNRLLEIGEQMLGEVDGVLGVA